MTFQLDLSPRQVEWMIKTLSLAHNSWVPAANDFEYVEDKNIGIQLIHNKGTGWLTILLLEVDDGNE